MRYLTNLCTFHMKKEKKKKNTLQNSANVFMKCSSPNHQRVSSGYRVRPFFVFLNVSMVHVSPLNIFHLQKSNLKIVISNSILSKKESFPNNMERHQNEKFTACQTYPSKFSMSLILKYWFNVQQMSIFHGKMECIKNVSQTINVNNIDMIELWTLLSVKMNTLFIWFGKASTLW